MIKRAGGQNGLADVVLMAQLIRAIAKYDPAYTEKVKLVVEAINEKLSQCEQLCLADVGRHVDFDCHRYIRLLCRRGYLTSAMGENRRISGYVRSKIWPPPPEFFEAGAIGLAYFLQTWFRYYLQQWIESSMSQVETHEGVYSWDYSRNDLIRQRLRGTNTDGGFVRGEDAEEVISTDHLDEIGGFDNTMVDKPLDLSGMTLDWVNATEDPIFKDLSRSDRLFLYMHFVRDMNLSMIAGFLQCGTRHARQRLNLILNKIRRSSNGLEAVCELNHPLIRSEKQGPSYCLRFVSS